MSADEISGDVDGASGSTAIGKNISQDTRNNANTTNVNVNLSPAERWVESVRREGLSMDAEQRLTDYVFGLTKEVSTLTAQLGSVATEMRKELQTSRERNELTQQLLDRLEQSFDRTFKITEVTISTLNSRLVSLEALALKAQQEHKPLFDKRTSNLLLLVGFLIIVLLGVNAWGSIFGG